ncbi:hypothetical protein ABPG72_011748 [Tetrahymena utriculariae]
MIQRASNLAEKEGNMCLQRMQFVEAKKEQAFKEQNLFIELVKRENTYDEYLNYSFTTHQNTINSITKTLLQYIFDNVEKLNQIIWDWKYGLYQIIEEPLKQQNVQLYKQIFNEVKDFIEIRSKPEFKFSRLIINSQVKFIRDYFLIFCKSEKSLSYLNFSNLDFILEMVDDCQKDTMINLLINIPYLQIQFQSIYQQKISNEQLLQFRIFRKIQIPPNMDIFVIFVQNKQWKQFKYSNFSYEFIHNQFKNIPLKNLEKEIYMYQPNLFSMELFISNEAGNISNIQIKTCNPKQKPYKIQNKFECLLKYYTYKLRNTLLYFCVFDKLYSPMMTFSSKQILYDLWDNLEQAQSPSYIYPFLEETFPFYDHSELEEDIPVSEISTEVLDKIKDFCETHNYNQDSMTYKFPFISAKLKENVDDKSYQILKEYDIDNVELRIQKLSPLLEAAFYLGFTKLKKIINTSIQVIFYCGPSEEEQEQFMQKWGLDNEDLTQDIQQEIKEQFSQLYNGYQQAMKSEIDVLIKQYQDGKKK